MFKSLWPSKKTNTAVSQTTPTDLQALIQAGGPLLLLDVRSPQEYAKDGHIIGSRLLPLNTLDGRIHELPRDIPIVCICRSGARSQVACETLSSLGFTQLINLRGGMIGWKRTGLQTA